MLGTSHANIPGFKGMSGVFAGSVYGILAFIGFDAAARLGEEARDPKRTIKFAVVGSALLVGLYYLLATYAASVFFGPDRMGNFPTFNDSNPWIGMARQVWGVGWVFVFIVLLNSAQENINGVANAGTRVMWSMGRIGLLPRAFARVSPRYRTPSTATIFNFVVGTGIAIALGVKYQPTVAFGLLGTVAVGLVIPVYMLVSLACVVFYLRERRSEFNPLTHLIVPVLGITAFAPPLLAGLGVTAFKFKWIAPLSYPLNLAGWIVTAWYVIGIVLAVVLTVSNPTRMHDTQRIFGDDEEPHLGVPQPPATG